MSQSKLDTSKTSLNQSFNKKEKNIREIYLQALNNNKGFSKTKKKNLTNLPDDRNGALSSSVFLEKEYNIVQRIISDTKELKKVVKESNKLDRQVSTRYKDPEEYYQEILELKKSLKIFEENEIVNRTKFEYYENELAKKEQEIIDLLDVKKTEEFRLLADSKADLATLVYGLKQKIFKLEFSLKRKENEFNKLKNDLKTTNMKELKIQNERLRLELSKALMSDKKVIESFDKDSNIDLQTNGRSSGLTDSKSNDSQASLNKSEIFKKNIAKQFNGNHENSSFLLPKLGNYESKISLSGSLKEKFEQLNQRETELLQEISRLNQDLERAKLKYSKIDLSSEKSKSRNKKQDSDSDAESYLNSARSSVRTNSRTSNRSPRKRLNDEKNQLNAIKSLQSVMRGHLERSSSLKRAEREREERRRSRSSSWRTPSPDRRRSISPYRSPRSPRRSREDNMRRTPTPLEEVERRGKKSPRRSPILRRSPPVRDSPVRRRQVTPQKSSSSDDEKDLSFSRKRSNDKKQLIERPDSKVDEAESNGCCSSWRSKKK